MNSSNFYKNVIFSLTNESKNLFVKQTNGLKFSCCGAVLFSDRNKSIKRLYESSSNLIKELSFRQLMKYTTIIFGNVQYKYENDIYYPLNEEIYKKALTYENLLPVTISYGNKNNDDKYISYDLLIETNLLNIERNTNLYFDGMVLLGRPYKQIKEEQNTYTLNILQEQEFCSIAIVYFPDEDEKIEIVKNQNNLTCMNIEEHFYMDEPIHLNNLSYTINDMIINKNPMKFIYGIHLTNDGLHNKG